METNQIDVQVKISDPATSSNLWRVFHWGPLVALFIIKWVTFITLYCNSMLWPPAESILGFLFTSVFLAFSSLTLFHFFCSLSIGPGFLPAGWGPGDTNAEECLQWCGVCGVQGTKITSLQEVWQMCPQDGSPLPLGQHLCWSQESWTLPGFPGICCVWVLHGHLFS